MAKAPAPGRAARLTRAQISAALKCGRRRDIPGKATVILAALRSEQLALIAVIATLDEQVKVLQGQVKAYLPPPGR